MPFKNSSGDLPARFLLDEAGESAWNMAVDESLLINSTINPDRIIVRIYGWDRWAVTLGRFQSLTRNFFYDRAKEMNIPVIRRITGGRAILHGDDVTISVVASLSALGFKHDSIFSAAKVYQVLSEPILEALNRTGLNTEMGACTLPSNNERMGDCFQGISRADIVDRRTGKKIVGAALHRRDNLVLQQASIPLNTSERADKLNQLKIALFGTDRPSDSNQQAILQDELRNELLRAYSLFFNSSMINSCLTEEERATVSKLRAERYTNPIWTADRP